MKLLGVFILCLIAVSYTFSLPVDDNSSSSSNSLENSSEKLLDKYPLKYKDSKDNVISDSQSLEDEDESEIENDDGDEDEISDDELLADGDDTETDDDSDENDSSDDQSLEDEDDDSDNKSDSEEKLVIEGIDVTDLSDEMLDDFVDALDEKFIGDLDLWVGKRTLAKLKSRRQKRWVPLAIRAGYSAFRVGRRLYRAARLYKTSRNAGRITRQYSRNGNYRKAVSDFHRLRPSNVRRFTGPNGVQGLSGRLGRNTIQVRNKSSGNKPTLEIFRTNKADRRVVRKVRYD